MKLFLKGIFFTWFSLLVLLPLMAQKQTTVTLQLKWKHQFQFAGYYAAIEKGFYRDAGLKVNLREAVQGENPAEAVLAGKAEFGVSNTDILIMRSRGKKVVVLANIFQHSPQVLLASKKSGIMHVHDLIGKKIAFEPNAADIIAFLNDEGVTSDKYITDQHSFNADKLINGEIDGISAYLTDEPFVLQEANFEYTIISPSMGGIDFYGDGLFTTEALLKTNPLLVEKFRAASLKGWKYAMKNPEEIIELIYQKYSKRHSREHLRFEADRMKNLIMPDVVEIGYTNPGRWEFIGDTYKKLKMVDASFQIEGLLYSDYQKKETKIPGKVIAGFLVIILVIASVTYFFYHVSRKLKIEIKNRLRVENKLSESEEQYRYLVENLPDAVIIYQDEKFVFGNKECLRLFGISSTEELTGKPVLQFVHPDHHALFIGRLKEAISFQKVLPSVEETLIRPDGSTVFVEVKAIPFLLRNKPVVQLVLHDLTLRKLSETALLESEEKFREMADLLPQIVFESDMQGVLTYANKSAFKILGYPENCDVSSINSVNLYIPEDRPRAIENIKRRLTGQRDDSNEYTMIRYDGSLINVLVYSNLIYRKNQPVGLRGIIIDITDRKLANQQIKQKNDELEKLNATKDKFFSIIAHDLKSPFNSIMGFSEILVNQVREKDYTGIEKYAEIILKSSQRALDLLMNLMEWSRSQTGRMDFSPEHFDMGDLIEELKILFDDIAGQKSIIIKKEFSANTTVFADKAMISTVLRNLISNAVKFTMPGGTITISIRERPDELIVSVRDSGIGIHEGRLEQLFRLSENYSTPGTNDEKGTGLGLILCKEFIENHGGKIWGESELNKGSTFSFSLPVIKL